MRDFAQELVDKVIDYCYEGMPGTASVETGPLLGLMVIPQ